jgi:DNA polymerase III epsilon subunit-like protein
MAGISFVIADIESSGLNTQMHEIIEISMIDFETRQQVFRQIRAHHPENASFDALQVCNKTLADLEEGVEQEEAVNTIDGFLAKINPNLNGICIVGHNVSFDRRFLHALWEKVGKRFGPLLWVDTLLMVKEHLKRADLSALNITKTATGRTSTKLIDCCTMLNVPRLNNPHSAVADTRATYFLFKKLMEDCGIDHLKHIKTIPHETEDDKAKVNEVNEVDFDPENDIE